MSRSWFKPLFAGAFFILSTFIAQAQQYPDHAQSTSTTVIVTVIWYEDAAAVDAFCALAMGEIPEGNILACYDPNTWTIHAVEPKSFNDLRGLVILGHEFWHALGAEHP